MNVNDEIEKPNTRNSLLDFSKVSELRERESSLLYEEVNAYLEDQPADFNVINENESRKSEVNARNEEKVGEVWQFNGTIKYITRISDTNKHNSDENKYLEMVKFSKDGNKFYV